MEFIFYVVSLLLIVINWGTDWIIVLAGFVLLICTGVIDYVVKKNKIEVRETEAEKKGKKGEDVLAENLSLLPFKILRNLYIPFRKGTTEVDIVAINKTGVYVIEVKTYSGCIKGNVADDNLTVSYADGNSYSMYNPIKQNRMHVAIIKHVLNIKNVWSIVAFVGDAQVELVGTALDTAICYNVKEVTNLLNTRHINVFTQQELQYISKKLERYTNVGDRVKREHIQQVKRKEVEK